MGNLVTKYTTNNIELNESNVSDVVDSEQVAKTPAASGQPRTGLFKNIWNYDPRSPSSFISRTPIAMFRNNSASKFKFNHQELNESIESQVDLDILTPEEQNSLDLNKDLAKNSPIDDLIADPRSPITEIARTPIVAIDEVKRKREDNLVKKLADKLISTAISNEDDKTITEEKLTIKKSNNQKNLIYEDDENMDRYSTPPKKAVVSSFKDAASTRTPLSCVANANTPKSRSFIPTSTPKSKVNMIDLNDENQRSSSRIPVSARRLH